MFVFSFASVWAGEATDCVIFADGFETNGGGASGQNTTFTGRLLDTNDFVLGTETPIVGATVSLLQTATSTISDSQGFFTLTDISDEVAVIDMDTSTAQPGPGSVNYAGFRERIEIKPCVANVIERPFFLPRIDASSLTQVNPNSTTVVNNAGIGVSITVPPHTAMMGDTEFTGQLSISEVPEGLAPAAMPGELQPGLLVTIQPVGVTFDTPVPITLPNIDNLLPDAVLDIWSLDPESGQFVVVGRGEVSPDGSQVETTVGGVRAADWHFAIQLAADILYFEELWGVTAPFFSQKLQQMLGSSRVSVRDGSLTIQHELPYIRSLGDEVGPHFVYHGRYASPRPVVNNTIRFPRASFIPEVPASVSSSVRVALMPVGKEVYTRTSTLSAAGDEELVQSVQFDASDIVTGVYLYDLLVTSHYESSSVGAMKFGFALINNQSSSHFGAGWMLKDLDRLYAPGNNVVSVVQGNGAVIAFLRAPEFTFFKNEEFSIDCCVESLVSGDFNNDGYPDLVDVGGSDNGVVRLNDKNGGFTVSVELGLGSTSAHTVAVGLINGDLNLDLAVSRGGNSITSKVTVLLGDGVGDFTAAGDFPVGQLPVDLDLGDFDGNGTLDIVTANRTAGTVSILRGDGNGGFSEAVDFNARGVATGGPNSIAVGDLDEDGNLDLAVLGPSAEMAILYGDGAGGLGDPVSYNVNGVSRAILIEDFNNDNHLDIVATTFTGSQNNVALFLGNGLGGFSAPNSIPVGIKPQTMAAGDLNLDGNLDLAVANVESSTVSILLGLGNGVLLPNKTLSFPELNRLGNDIVAIADFNLDLYPDLAVHDTGSFSIDDVYIIDNLSVESEQFTSPAGIFSRLFENEDGSYRHLLTTGVSVEFDSEGFQTGRIDRFGNEIAYEYDGIHRLQSITYPTGQVFDFDYSANTITITDPANRQTQLFRDGSGDLVRISSPDGGQTHYSYGSRHELESLTTPGGHTYNYQYNYNGMIEQVTLPNGEVRQFQPGLAMGLPESAGQGTAGNPLPALKNTDVVDIFIDGLDNQTTFSTTRSGAMTSTVDALNRKITAERDNRDLVYSIRLANLETLEFTYDDRGNMLSSTDAFDAVTRYHYNEQNQLKGFINALGDQVVLGYDERGARVSYDDGTATLTNTYTARGLLATASDTQNNTTTYDYDANGNLVLISDAEGHTTEFVWDAAGNITSASNDVGQSATFTFDSMNRRLSITNELSETTTFSYDMQGNLATAGGPAGLLFTFTYDAMRRVTSQTDALGRQTHYGYDVLRNLTSVTSPNGTSISYAYDGINRLTDISASTGEQVGFEFNTLGQMIRMENNDSLIEAQHDKMGRTTRITYNAGGKYSNQPPNVGYSLSYDDADQLIGVTQVDGTPLTYTYDTRGVLSGITTPNIDHQLTVDNTGRPTILATQITGGVASGFVRSYTPTDQLDGLDIDINGATAFQYLISLDDLGNRIGITDNGGERSYSYDATSQLLTASHPDRPDETYTYDDLGNRLSSAFTSGSIDYDSANQVQQDGEFSYGFDLNGNLVTKTRLNTGEVTIYSYNAFDQLMSIDLQDDMGTTISLTTYAYNAMGRRISKNVNGKVTKYVHQSDRLVASYDGSDNLLATYLHGPEPNMVLSMETLGEQFVFHRDAIGSVIAISDRFGSIVNEYVYDSFGRLISQSESVDNPFGFTGAERDGESGLHYMLARYYDPFGGRFIQPDPRGFPSGLNLYHYVSNNPLVFTDPDGEVLWGAAFGAGINRFDQALDKRSSAKDTKPLNTDEFIFDTAMGAASCGIGNWVKGARLTGISETIVKYGVNFMESVFSTLAKPAFSGGKPPSADEFVRNVTWGTFGGIPSRKAGNPFLKRFPDGSDAREFGDKTASWMLSHPYKKAYDEAISDKP